MLYSIGKPVFKMKPSHTYFHGPSFLIIQPNLLITKTLAQYHAVGSAFLAAMREV